MKIMESLRFKPTGSWVMDDPSPFVDYSGYGRSATISGTEIHGLPLSADAVYSQSLNKSLTATFASPSFVAGKEGHPFSLAATVAPVFKTEGLEAQTYYENIVYNPSAELNVTNIRKIGSSVSTAIARYTTTSVVGGASVGYDLTGTTGGAGGINWSIIPQTGAGRVVRWSCWALSSVATTCSVYGEGIVNATGAYAGFPVPNTTTTLPANTWTLVSGEITLTDDRTIDRVGFLISSASPQVGQQIRGDACLTVVDEPLPGYFDGSIAGYAWSGTAHNSMSYARQDIYGVNIVRNPGVYAVAIGSTVQQWNHSTNTSSGGVQKSLVLKSDPIEGTVGSFQQTDAESVSWNVLSANLDGPTVIRAGDNVRIRLRIKSNLVNATSNSFAMRLAQANGQMPATDNHLFNITNNFEDYIYDTVAIASVTKDNLLYISIPLNADIDFEISHASVTINNHGEGYFDGATAGAAWFGTPNASASLMYVSNSEQQILGNQNQLDGLLVDGNTFHFVTKYANTGEARCSYTIDTARKVDVVGVHTAAKNSLYIDKELVAEVDITEAQQADTYVTTNGNLYSGATTSSQNLLINNVSTFSTALSEEDIARIYSANNRVAEGEVPKMFGGEDIFVSSIVRPAQVQALWSDEDDWEFGEGEMVAIDNGQLVAQIIDDATLAGRWETSCDLYSGETPTLLESANLFWYGEGETVEVSLDGDTWSAVTKGEPISILPSGFNPTDKSLFIRVSFEAGRDFAYIDYIQFRAYTSNTATSAHHVITYGANAVVMDEHHPSKMRDDWGVKLNGSTLTIAPDLISEVPMSISTVEIWLKREDDAGATFSSNLTGATNFYSNGEVGTGYRIGEWTVRHFTFAAPTSGDITIGGNVQVGKVAIYPTALSVSDIAAVVANYTGVRSVPADASGLVNIAESPTSTVVYAHDWEIVAS